jgi:hypothetical protein
VSDPFPSLPREAQDVFRREVSPALDDGRRAIDAVGLRPWRVYLVIDKYSGTRHKEGELVERELTQMDPNPEIRSLSATELAASGGVLRSGDVSVSQISRDYTMEQLRGRTLAGDDLPGSWDFYYAIQYDEQIHAEFYNLASTPLLNSTAWRLTLRPRNKRGPLNIGPD